MFYFLFSVLSVPPAPLTLAKGSVALVKLYWLFNASVSWLVSTILVAKYYDHHLFIPVHQIQVTCFSVENIYPFTLLTWWNLSMPFKTLLKLLIQGSYSTFCFLYHHWKHYIVNVHFIIIINFPLIRDDITALTVMKTQLPTVHFLLCPFSPRYLLCRSYSPKVISKLLNSV